MKVGEQDTEYLVDLMRSTPDRDSALRLLDSLCRTAHAEGVIAGSKATGDLINKTFDAMLGVQSPEGTIQ